MTSFIIKLCTLFVAVFTLIIWLNFGPPKMQHIEANLTPDQYGYIHHPKYGDYPAAIPWDDAATLLPGQHMEHTFTYDYEVQHDNRLGLERTY